MAAGGGYLLDTCVLLWWLSGDARLSGIWEERLREVRCLVSAASIWQTAIKHRLGKLPVCPLDLTQAAATAGFEMLTISPEHAAATATLPLHHQDPFRSPVDRPGQVGGRAAAELRSHPQGLRLRCETALN